MNSTDNRKTTASLRAEAEKLLKLKSKSGESEQAAVDILTLVHELEVYQIELELQNEALVHSNEEAKSASKKYFELYNFAPMGYFTITKEGTIVEANQISADMFGEESMRLEGRSVLSFIDAGSKSAFNGLLDRIQKSKVIEYCDVTIVSAVGVQLDAHLSGVVSENCEMVLISILDISDRITSVKALYDSEKKFRDFYEEAPIGLYRTTPDGRIIMANRSLVAMLGFSSFEELSVMNLEESGFEPSYPRKQFIEKIERDGVVNDLVSVWKCRDGSSVTVNEHARIVRDHKGRTLYYDGIAEDVTEQVRLEKVVQENEEIFKQYFIHSPVYIFIKDAHMRAIRLSANFETLLGKPIHELLGRTSSELFPSEFAEKIDHDDRSLLQEGKTDSFEEELNGRYYSTIKFPIIINGAPEYLGGFTIDITDRIRYEESVRQNEERYRSLFHDNFAVILLVDPVTGEINDANSSACSYYGYTHDELCWMNIREINTLSKEEIENEMQLAVNNRQGHFNFKHRLAGGEVRDVEVISSLIDIGRSSLLYSLIYDTTEHNLTKQKLEQAEHRLRQAEKMEAIGQLAGGIAHDFNNILTGIIGFASLSQRQAENDPALKSNIEQVLAASNRAKELTHQILAFSRQSVQQKEVVNITPIVDEALKLMRASIPSTVTIEYSNLGMSKPVLADPVRIHEIILNLANNAVHAMAQQGTLLIRLSSKVFEQSVSVHTGELPAGEYSVIECIDTGCGMDLQTIAKAFEPFFTTKGVGEGTGMGLSVVLGIVQSHGGNIHVESTPGKGTEFKIYLPITAEALFKGETSPAKAETAGTERLLFVDDEQLLTDLAELELPLYGYSIICKSDGKEALEYFEQHIDEFDILITDQTMPGLSGMNLAAEVMKIRKDLPVILCSGYSSTVNPDSAKAAGIGHYLEKPYEFTDLCSVIRKVIDQRKK